MSKDWTLDHISEFYGWAGGNESERHASIRAIIKAEPIKASVGNVTDFKINTHWLHRSRLDGKKAKNTIRSIK